MKRILTRIDLLALAVLVVFGSIGSAGFADENTVNLQSIVLQTFDDGVEGESQWFVVGSRFSEPEYPKSKFVNTWPISLHGTNPKNRDKLRVLGVAMMFTRREFNWVDVVPGTKETKDGKLVVYPTEIPIPGRARQIDVWVWSPNMNYYIEAFVRDYTGIVHVIPIGDLTFTGWKNMSALIPTNIPQSKKYLPHKEGLKLVKFRIWGRPQEVAALPVNESDPDYMKAITFYFDNIKIMTDTFETLFDGDDLVSQEMLESTWGGEDK